MGTRRSSRRLMRHTKFSGMRRNVKYTTNMEKRQSKMELGLVVLEEQVIYLTCSAWVAWAVAPSVNVEVRMWCIE